MIVGCTAGWCGFGLVSRGFGLLKGGDRVEL